MNILKHVLVITLAKLLFPMNYLHPLTPYGRYKRARGNVEPHDQDILEAFPVICVCVCVCACALGSSTVTTVMYFPLKINT